MTTVDPNGIPTVKPPSIAAQIAAGRAARERVGWEGLAALTTTGRDPLRILDEQDETRLPQLVPLRTERMSASPFTFYRGTAALMAADLGRHPHSGISVASCGDAHVSNFGFYASPQRTLVFDLNDFDEAAWAPWEWDLKRLVASVVIAGQSTARDEAVVRRAASDAIAAYLETLREALRRSPAQRYFLHFDANHAERELDRPSRAVLKAAIKGASKRTGQRAAARLTALTADGQRRFVTQPPVLTAIDDETATRVIDSLEQFDRSAAVDIRVLMRHYALADIALRVVGVGSVGTRCYVVLFEDGEGNTLILQVKEAGRSVLEQYGGAAQPSQAQEVIAAGGEGARVVGMQRILQGLSDPFLGFIKRTDRGFYVRQFHDMKGGIDIDTLDDKPFKRYAAACGAVLARAHSQSRAAGEILGFAGKGRRLSEAIISWATDYARLSKADYESFLAARDSTPA